jgi:hypothetical protein
LTSHYLDPGTYIVGGPFRGSLGKVTIRNQKRKGRTRNVTFVDLAGRIAVRPKELRDGLGPVSNVKSGLHERMTRVSFNFHDELSPESSSVELYCKPGRIAFKLSMDMGGSGEGPGAGGGDSGEAPPSEGPGAGGAGASGDEGPQGDGPQGGPGENPGPQAGDMASPTGDAAPAEEAPKGPDFNLRNYESCAGNGQGSGTIDSLWTKVDGKGTIIVVIPIQGAFGAMGMADYISDQENPHSVVTFEGAFSINNADKKVSEGKVSHIQFKAAEKQSELVISYAPGTVISSVIPDFYCKKGALALRLTLDAR